jgi:hypothetical protein
MHGCTGFHILVGKPRLSDLELGRHSEDELILLVHPVDPQPPVGDGGPRGGIVVHLAHEHYTQSHSTLLSIYSMCTL